MIIQEPYKRPMTLSLLRVFGEIDAAKVCIIRSFNKSDGRWVIKNSREVESWQWVESG